MAGAAEIVAQLPDDGTDWWALVPNRRGAEMAVAAGAIAHHGHGLGVAGVQREERRT